MRVDAERKPRQQPSLATISSRGRRECPSSPSRRGTVSRVVSPQLPQRPNLRATQRCTPGVPFFMRFTWSVPVSRSTLSHLSATNSRPAAVTVRQHDDASSLRPCLPTAVPLPASCHLGGVRYSRFVRGVRSRFGASFHSRCLTSRNPMSIPLYSGVRSRQLSHFHQFSGEFRPAR